MALIKWEPFGDLEKFFDDERFSFLPRVGSDLAVDVYENGDNVVVEMNIPGIDPEKTDISVEDEMLRVSGSREEEKEDKKKDYYSKEIRRGSFERVVRLPYPVMEEKTEAEVKDGVLKVTLPKRGEEKRKQIKISVKK